MSPVEAPSEMILFDQGFDFSPVVGLQEGRVFQGQAPFGIELAQDKPGALEVFAVARIR